MRKLLVLAPIFLLLLFSPVMGLDTNNWNTTTDDLGRLVLTPDGKQKYTIRNITTEGRWIEISFFANYTNSGIDCVYGWCNWVFLVNNYAVGPSDYWFWFYYDAYYEQLRLLNGTDYANCSGVLNDGKIYLVNVTVFSNNSVAVFVNGTTTCALSLPSSYYSRNLTFITEMRVQSLFVTDILGIAEALPNITTTTTTTIPATTTIPTAPTMARCQIMDCSYLTGFPMVIIRILCITANFFFCVPILLGIMIVLLALYRISRGK